jgi:4'-phosphopantetheinyl transferase
MMPELPLIWWTRLPSEMNSQEPIPDTSYHEHLPARLAKLVLGYRKEDDRRRLLAGKLLLKHFLQETLGSDELLNAYQIKENGKPTIPGFYEFNLTHSGSRVCLALSETAVGIDVEKIRPIDIDLFTRQFTEIEIQQIKSADDPTAKFFEYWTIKESVMKADGRGMRIPLHSIQIFSGHALVGDSSTPWFVYPLDFGENYKSHICFREAGLQLDLKEVPLVF